MMLFSASFHDFFMAHFVDHDKEIVTRASPLSKRENQCLELAANGMTSIDIGAKLGITERTANFHFGNLIQKMGVLNRQEAIAVGVSSVLRPDDRVVSNHRGHGHLIAKGADIESRECRCHRMRVARVGLVAATLDATRTTLSSRDHVSW